MRDNCEPRRQKGLPNRHKSSPRLAKERRPFERTESSRTISCGAVSWPASDASCGPAYAALFPISSFPQGLPNGWCDDLLFALPPGESPILAWTSQGRQARSEVGDLSHRYFRRGKPRGLRLPVESFAVRRSKIALIHCEWAIQDSNL
jgi:hypothetical protein